MITILDSLGKEIATTGLDAVLQKKLDNNEIITSQEMIVKILNDDYKKQNIDNINITNKKIVKYSNINLYSTNIIDQEYISNDIVILDIVPHYYHFIIDILGKFLLIKSINNNVKPFFVELPHNKNIGGNLNSVIKEIIDIFSEHYPIEKNITINNSKSFLFKNAYFIDSLENRLGSNHMFRQNFIIKQLREIFLPKRKSKNDKKIFISRKPWQVRNFEFLPELESFLLNQGYEVVYFEDMSFQEQIECVYDANKIVSLVGSGLTNLLFTNLSAKVISISIDPEQVATECRKMADTVGIEYIEIYINQKNLKPLPSILSHLIAI